MPSVYARQGYVREELVSAADVRSYERTTGRLHERSHYDPGSATAERELERSLEPEHKSDPALIARLASSLGEVGE